MGYNSRKGLEVMIALLFMWNYACELDVAYPYENPNVITQ
jgi:hypothetical protein